MSRGLCIISVKRCVYIFPYHFSEDRRHGNVREIKISTLVCTRGPSDGIYCKAKSLPAFSLGGRGIRETCGNQDIYTRYLTVMERKIIEH